MQDLPFLCVCVYIYIHNSNLGNGKKNKTNIYNYSTESIISKDHKKTHTNVQSIYSKKS